VDWAALHAALQRLHSSLPRARADAALDALRRLLSPAQPAALPHSLKWVAADAQAAVLVSLLLSPALESVEAYEDVAVPLLQLVESSRLACAAALSAELSRLAPPQMSHLVFVLQQFMTLRLYRTRALDVTVACCCNVLQVRGRG